MIYAEVKQDGTLHQVWSGVNDQDFNPPLLPGSTLVSWPDGTDVRPGMIWNGTQLLPPPPPPISSIKEQAKQQVIDYALKIEQELTAGYTQGEVASWPAKLDAAYAYLAGTPTNAQRVMIETEAAEKKVLPNDLCNAIINKGEWYSEATALIASLRSNNFKAIDAAKTELEVDTILQNALTYANQKWVDLISRMP